MEERNIRLATLIGALAIFLWALLAWLTSLTGDVPPFALVGMTFGIAFLLWCCRALWIFHRTGFQSFSFLHQPFRIWCLGIGGLFLYHALYFAALDRAPPIDASLIAYLWPLLIVLFSGFLPGENLRLLHIVGAVLGFMGAALILLQKGDFAFTGTYLWGYVLAFLCAFTWSGYSVLSRLAGSVPSDIVGPCCGATSLLGWMTHFLCEPQLTPMEGPQCMAVLALGMGPVGIAFFVWDYGVKRGDIRLLGTISYFSPLLSSLVLILSGKASPNAALLGAAGLIASGAFLASRGGRPWRRRPAS